MKKKILTLMILFLMTSCISGLLFPGTAKAEETTVLNQIRITRYPTKLTYAKGESLNFSDMLVEGYYMDGTSKMITDYKIDGFDSNRIGVQTVYINYQNYMTSLNVTVIPSKVSNFTVTNVSTTSFTLTWDAIQDVTRYEIYGINPITGIYGLITSTYYNYYSFNYPPGTTHDFQVCAVYSSGGMEYKGELSDPFTAATAPDMVTGLTVTGATTTYVDLSWNAVANATGYLVYRAVAGSTDFTYIGETKSNFYSDSKVSSGTGYQYKVSAFLYNKTFSGALSNMVDISTYPKEVLLNYKAGDQKVRLNWTKINGASSYDIYIGDEVNGFTLLTNLPVDSTGYIAEGLVNGTTYSFYAIARRTYNGVAYDSEVVSTVSATPVVVKDTSTAGKYFSNEAAFKKAVAYKEIEFFRTNVKYSKSFVIPGLVTTNIGGFASVSMCPQGITFTKDYLLMTAYDMKSEENSVIYVMDKSTKKLLTTLILPSKTHAGGIAYDGTNVWIPTGTRVSSIPFDEIEMAVLGGEPYSYINYNTTSQVDLTVSYMTYYDDMLWLGTYNELQTTKMYSYSIDDIESEPSLMQQYTVTMPTRVQGMAFTSKGNLILSRSCQLYKGLRGYMRQLDLYLPDFSAISDDGIIPLGESLKTMEMPSMNEDIAIDGDYLYVNFESGAFANASYQMDRISAFKLSTITKKTAKAK
jgi:fibronectin type 3 domain-containing protein